MYNLTMSFTNKLANVKLSDDFLIAIEGIDGSGKSTTSSKLSQLLNAEVLEKGLSKVLGIDEYISQRNEINKFKNANTIDFYIKSYMVAHNSKRIIADRYIGSLYAWGVDKNNIDYFYEEVTKLRRPKIAVLLNGDENVIRERIKKRDKVEDEIYKASLVYRHHEKHKEIYSKLGIPFVEIDTTSSSQDSQIEEIIKAIYEKIDSSFTLPDFQFKYTNALQVFGFIEDKYNVYIKDDFCFDCNDFIYTNNNAKYHFYDKETFYICVLNYILESHGIKSQITNFSLIVDNKHIYINTKMSSNINVKIDAGFLYIDWTNINDKIAMVFSEYKNNDNLEGDCFIDQDIKEFHISPATNQLGDNPFAGSIINKLTSTNERFVIEGDMLIDKKYMKLIHYNGTSSDLIIPEGILSIGKHAFYKKEFKSVTLPKTLVQVINNPFSHSDNVKVINNSKYFYDDGNALYSVDKKHLFSLHSNIHEYKINDLTKRIGKNSFYNRVNLKKVFISDELDFIGHNPFSKVNESFDIIISEKNKMLTKKASAIIWNKSTLVKYLDNSPKQLIDNDFMIISRNAFANLNAISEVFFKNEIYSVQRGAFQSMNNLEKVHFINKPIIESKNPIEKFKWGN